MIYLPVHLVEFYGSYGIVSKHNMFLGHVVHAFEQAISVGPSLPEVAKVTLG